MKIIIYRCLDDADALPDLAEGSKGARVVIGKPLFIGRIRCAMPGVGGRTVIGWHPVLHEGVSAEAVRTKLQTWWDAEVAKVAKAEGKAAKPKRKPMEAAPGTEAVEIEEEEAIG